MKRETCPRCGAGRSSDRRFCSRCGYQLAGRPADLARRAVGAILLVYLGVFATLIATAWLLPEEDASNAGILLSSLLANAGFLLAAVLALAVLGRGAWRESFARGPAPGALGLALLVGGATFLVALGYWKLLLWLAPPQPAPLPVEPFTLSPVVLVVVTVLLPALGEEWTDRGVLWIALRRVAGPGATLFGTALLFAFMHGLGGGGILEVPHRFVAGLAFGWLRLRTGSLVPGIVAHATHNTLAILV